MGASVPHSVRQEYPVRNDISVTLNTCNYPQEYMENYGIVFSTAVTKHSAEKNAQILFRIWID